MAAIDRITNGIRIARNKYSGAVSGITPNASANKASSR
jgi:hypothetical protein